MFNRGNYIFNQNFQKGTSSTKKTNFGIIQEPDHLLFRADFYSKETFSFEILVLTLILSPKETVFTEPEQPKILTEGKL